MSYFSYLKLNQIDLIQPVHQDVFLYCGVYSLG